MRIDIQKIIDISNIEEQDIHIHVGSGGSTSSPSTSTSSQSSSQGQSDNSNNQQNTSQSSNTSAAQNPAQALKKQLQQNQQQSTAGATQSNNQQYSLSGPVQHPTSLHPVQHQNNVRHVGQMMSQNGLRNTQNNSPVKITRPRFNESTKREMKEIYVKDHIRRIGRRPTSQDVARKFTNL